MHPLNEILSVFGLNLARVNKTMVPRDEKEKNFRKQYAFGLEQAKNNQRRFEVYEAYRYDIGERPKTQKDFEFEFVAYHLQKAKPLQILDIGTYRHFLLGLLAHYNVTTVDIRKRRSALKNETIVNCDAKALNFDNNSFDSVITLQALPHLGLGRYGDEIDFDADIKAFHEIIRVLKPGGMLIFSTAITGGSPSIAWNARRNYSHQMIIAFCKELDLVEEKFFDRQRRCFCDLAELTTDPTLFDYYLGCWKKKQG